MSIETNRFKSVSGQLPQKPNPQPSREFRNGQPVVSDIRPAPKPTVIASPMPFLGPVAQAPVVQGSSSNQLNAQQGSYPTVQYAAGYQPRPEARPIVTSSALPVTKTITIPPSDQYINPVKAAVQQTQVPAINQTAASTASAPQPTVAININLPKLKRPELPKLPYKKIGLILVGVLVLAGIGLTARYFIDRAITHNRLEKALHNVQAADGPHRTSPSFVPAMPADKQSLATNASAVSTAYDGSRNSYSYDDVIDGTTITVSQQPIPKNFSSSGEAVVAIAKQLGATTPILSAASTAYMENDAKTGSQVIVYSLKNILVLINSPFKHSTADWATYLNSLEQ